MLFNQKRQFNLSLLSYRLIDKMYQVSWKKAIKNILLICTPLGFEWIEIDFLNLLYERHLLTMEILIRIFLKRPNWRFSIIAHTHFLTVCLFGQRERERERERGNNCVNTIHSAIFIIINFSIVCWKLLMFKKRKKEKLLSKKKKTCTWWAQHHHIHHKKPVFFSLVHHDQRKEAAVSITTITTATTTKTKFYIPFLSKWNVRLLFCSH